MNAMLNQELKQAREPSVCAQGLPLAFVTVTILTNL